MTRIENIKPWCVDPFIQMSHTADGYYRVCCVGEVDRRNNNYITKNMTPKEYWNSDEAKQIRNDMLSGNFSETTKRACSICILNEKNKIKSRRERENFLYMNTELLKNNVDLHLQNKDLEYTNLCYVYFKVLGNLCNLKCIMCVPSASSKIASESKKYFNFDGNTNLEPFNEHTKNKYFQEIEKIVEAVDQFNLIGGETLIHPNFNKVFNIFLKKDPENFKLRIVTNATVIPDIIYQNAHRFKKLEMIISIDGIGTKGEYIRHGLNWIKFKENIQKLQSHKDIHLHFTTATQMLNVGYVGEIYDFIKSLDIDPNSMIFDNLVTHPRIFRAINLPVDIKQEYLKNLKNHEFYYKHYNLIKTIEDILLLPQESHEEFLAGIKRLKQLDKVRKINLIDYFPEFKSFYEKIKV